MGDSTEDFEPLFDYTRVQPTSFICIDDDNSDASPVPIKKRQKISKPSVDELDDDDDLKVVKVIEVAKSKDEDEEDWLPPPPKVADLEKRLGEDSTIKELRLKKQELQSLLAKSADMFQVVEESLKNNHNDSMQASLEGVGDKSSKPSSERAKIVISIQDKDGPKQFRVYKDDKFARLFKMYADKVKIGIGSLVFMFDGDKIDPTASPDSLGLEEEDIIEVHVKKT